MTVVINGTTGIDTGTGSLIAADSTTPTYLDLFEDTDNGSNYVRLIAPTSVASNKTITLPDATGTMVVGSAAVSAVGQIPFSTDGSSYTPTAKIVSGTAITLTNQTAPEFTGIPSWVKRITVMFRAVQTNGAGAASIILQVGSGSYSTSGYTSYGGIFTGTNVTSTYTNTTGITVTAGMGNASLISGHLLLTLVENNQWVGSAILGGTDGSGAIVMRSSGGFTPNLSGALDRVRLNTTNGTDQFDGGTLNILYE